MLSTTPAEHEGDEARTRHARYNAIAAQGKAKLIFLGDSITQGWEDPGKHAWETLIASRFAGGEVANFGVSGDRTENVLWRIDHGNFDNLKPSLIVIMLGTNNAGHRREPSTETALGIQAVLDRLKVKCPQSRILLLGIFPRGERADDPVRALTDGTNAIIKKFADGKRVVYRDIGHVFLDDRGILHKDIMPDFLHLSPKGYELWAKAIEDEVKNAAHVR